MLDQIFGRISSSQWIVFLALVILLVGLAELAWRMGFARSWRKSEEEKDSGTVRSAVLALLGLLLGFSFAIAASRNEARRELLVEEANSIGMTARQAELLPQPHASNVVRFLQEYVPLRIEAHREWCSHEELHCRSTWSSAMIAYDFVAPHESQQTSNEK